MIVAALAVATPRAAIVATRSIVTGARRCADEPSFSLLNAFFVLEKMRSTTKKRSTSPKASRFAA